MQLLHLYFDCVGYVCFWIAVGASERCAELTDNANQNYEGPHGKATGRALPHATEIEKWGTPIFDLYSRR